MHRVKNTFISNRTIEDRVFEYDCFEQCSGNRILRLWSIVNNENLKLDIHKFSISHNAYEFRNSNLECWLRNLYSTIHLMNNTKAYLCISPLFSTVASNFKMSSFWYIVDFSSVLWKSLYKSVLMVAEVHFRVYCLKKLSCMMYS